MAKKELMLDTSDGIKEGHVLPAIAEDPAGAEFGPEGTTKKELKAYEDAHKRAFGVAYAKQLKEDAENAIKATGFDPEIFGKVSDTAMAETVALTELDEWNEFSDTTGETRQPAGYPTNSEGSAPKIDALTARELVGANADRSLHNPEQ